MAAKPLTSDAYRWVRIPNDPSTILIDQATGAPLGPVETFDPAARATVLARELPRRWSGTYQAFGTGMVVPVSLNLTAVRPRGAMVTLQGEISIAGRLSPIQGNLNAKSDQLDLIPLGDELGGGLEAGGQFQGLQGLELSGWNAGRLTDQGGRLALKPGYIAIASAGKPSALPSGVRPRPRAGAVNRTERSWSRLQGRWSRVQRRWNQAAWLAPSWRSSRASRLRAVRFPDWSASTWR